MQTLPQRKINYHLPTWIIINKRNELVSSCSHRGKALLRNNWTKFTATPIMQVRKVYKRWLRIFLTIKSPDEWVITKQACRDESIVSFFPFLNICVYIFVCVCACVCVRACVCVCVCILGLSMSSFFSFFCSKQCFCQNKTLKFVIVSPTFT